MVTFRGISASVEVGGIDLPHYQPEFDEATKSATCWIPSEAGKEFTIRWEAEEHVCPRGNFSADVYLDGDSEAKIGIADECGRGATVPGMVVSDTEVRAFMFGDIHTTGKSLLCSKI